MLAGGGIVAVYSSPLRRARQIAEVIAAACAVTVTEAPDLVDLDYGEWEGLTGEEACARDPVLFRRFLERPRTVRLPGGEAIADVEHRVLDAVRCLAARHQGAPVVAVSHEVPIRLVAAWVRGISGPRIWEPDLPIGSITTLAVEGGEVSLAARREGPGKTRDRILAPGARLALAHGPALPLSGRAAVVVLVDSSTTGYASAVRPWTEIGSWVVASLAVVASLVPPAWGGGPGGGTREPPGATVLAPTLSEVTARLGPRLTDRHLRPTDQRSRLDPLPLGVGAAAVAAPVPGLGFSLVGGPFLGSTSRPSVVPLHTPRGPPGLRTP